MCWVRYLPVDLSRAMTDILQAYARGLSCLWGVCSNNETYAMPTQPMRNKTSRTPIPTVQAQPKLHSLSVLQKLPHNICFATQLTSGCIKSDAGTGKHPKLSKAPVRIEGLLAPASLAERKRHSPKREWASGVRSAPALLDNACVLRSAFCCSGCCCFGQAKVCVV